VLTNLVVTCVVVAITVALGWFTWQMRRSTNKLAKWSVLVVGGFLTLLCTLVSVLGVKGLAFAYTPRGGPVRDLKVERTPERVARGKHIAEMWCAGCHTKNTELPLSGGRNLSDDAHMPLGDLYPINLTPAGPTKDWTDGQIFRAIRRGADNNGKRLPVMSAQRVRNLSDDDIMSVIAYLRSQPPVDNLTPPPRLSFLTVVMAGAGALPYLPDLPPDTSIAAPAPDTTAEYGHYMVKWIGCDECHGALYKGGGGGVMPVAPSIHSVKSWTLEGFIATMRTGKTPFGKELNADMMPWKLVGRGTDAELKAIYKYLKTLPE
jgi:mono/diheme cytochrome c family protein